MLPATVRGACPLHVAEWGSLAGETPPGLTNIVAVAAGASHSLGLKSDGTVLAWGDDLYGKANPPENLSNVVAIAAGDLHSLALRSDGSVVGWGYNGNDVATPPTNLIGVVAIAAGGYHNLALKNDGRVVAWGDGSYGQTLVPTNLSGVVAISAGYFHSLALKSDGTVVAWGGNSYGQATPPTNLTGVVQIAAGYLHSLALKNDGTVVGWGNDDYGQRTPPLNATGVVAIAVGYFHSLALRNDGAVVGWGNNDYEQGNSGGLTAANAISVGGYHNMALAAGPNAPSKLTARVMATNRIDLSWQNNATDADFFKIERAPDTNGIAGTWAALATVGVAVTNYSDLSVTTNLTFWYRVRAQNSCGDSLSTLSVSIFTGVPDFPQNLSAQIGFSNVVDLTWYQYVNAASGFKIQRAPNASGVPGTWSDIASIAQVGLFTFSYSDAGATPNATNWYRVQATNGIGSSALSSPVSQAVIPPTAPLYFFATPFSDRVEFYWYDYFGGVMGFKLERAPDNGGTPGAWTEISTTSPALISNGSYIATDVVTNLSYWFRVRAFNWIGYSPYSISNRITIAPPAPPSNLTAVNNGRGQIELAWTNSDTNTSGFKMERAMVVNGAVGEWIQIAQTYSLATRYFDSGLNVYASYRYRIRTYNSVGDSLPSNEAGAFVRDSEFVRVMQWNTERSLGRLANNSSSAAQAIARVINFNQPDILLFNEIDTQSLSPAQNVTALINWVTNWIPYLGAQPGATFYVAASSQSDGFIRNAAISRYPILGATTYNDGLRGLHAFKVQISVSNALQFFHTHIKCCADDCNRKQVEAQFDANVMSAFAATNALPYIFAGDLNEEEEKSPPVCTLTGSYHPITTIRQGGSLRDFKPTSLNGEYRTWSSQATTPSIRFDYILASSNRIAQPSGYVFNSQEWAVQGLYSGYSDTYTASDHFPVFANYSFPGPFEIWQARNFGNATNSAAAPDNDFDGDGLNNLKEFFAGTSPTNSASVLRILSAVRTNNDVRVIWLTAGGKTNVVQAAAQLDGDFTNVSSQLLIMGSGDTTTNYLELGAATNSPARFYRIRLAP